MLTLAAILLVVLAAVVAVVWGWTRYRLAVYDAQHADELIVANRASARPGMAVPDPRFHARRTDRPLPRDEDRDMCC